MANNWIYTTENSIFTILTTKIKKKYSDITCTRDGQPSDATNHFPCMYARFLSIELGETLNDDEVNAIMSTIKLSVIGNKTVTMNKTRQIAFDCITILKGLGYKATMMPQIQETNNETIVYVFEVRRVIGALDTIKG
jgi:hypothetical protein